MPTRKISRPMTKKEFLGKVAHGTLSVDQVTGKLAEELQDFEQKYQMRSEIFYALIVGTPAEDQPDFLQWAIAYRSYFRAFQAKFPVKELTDYAV